MKIRMAVRPNHRSDAVRGAVHPITVNPQFAPSAARLAIDLGHPAYDCFCLALAVQEQYPVITADRRFYDIVRRHPYLSDLVVHVESLRR